MRRWRVVLPFSVYLVRGFGLGLRRRRALESPAVAAASSSLVDGASDAAGTGVGAACSAAAAAGVGVADAGVAVAAGFLAAAFFTSWQHAAWPRTPRAPACMYGRAGRHVGRQACGLGGWRGSVCARVCECMGVSVWAVGTTCAMSGMNVWKNPTSSLKRFGSNNTPLYQRQCQKSINPSINLCSAAVCAKNMHAGRQPDMQAGRHAGMQVGGMQACR